LHGFLGRLSNQIEELLGRFLEICEAYDNLDTSHQNVHYFGYTTSNDARVFVGNKI
jgi:hypothetical protein